MSNPLTRATPVIRPATGLIPTISGRPGGGSTRLVQLVLLALLVAFFVALPYLGASKFQVGQTTTILIAAMTAASVNFLVGGAGLASLGHGAIAGSASYAIAWAYKQGWDAGVSVLLAIGLTLIVSLIYGVLTMRTSGIYFLMVTLALGMLIYGLAFRMSSITGGDNGILLQRPDWINPRDNWWIFYYFVLAILILITFVLWIVGRSAFGASLRGVRDNEGRMRSLGYSVAGYKVAAFMISGFVAGISGVLGAWNTQSVSPDSVNVETSILLIVMVILGGVGTLLGPLVGAAIVILVRFTVSSYIDRWQTLLGIVFIVVILLARRGLVGSIGQLVNRLLRRRHNGTADGGTPEAAHPRRPFVTPHERNSMMSRKMSARARILAVAGLGVAAALTLAACAPPGSGQDNTAPGKTGTLKVGFISPTSGTFAVAGQQMQDGWKFYWDQASNKAGKIKVETTYEDDTGDVNQSLAKAKQLVEQDGVDIVVGPLIANTASAVAAYTFSQGIPNLEPVAASNNLTLSGANDLTVRTSSMGGTQANYPGGQWAATKGDAKTAVTLCSDYSFGWESCAGFKQGFEAEGGKVLQQIWAPNGTTDFSSYVSQLLASKADLIYVATAGGAPGPAFLNAYLSAGGDIDKLLANCCAADQGTLVSLDKAGNGDKIVGLKSVSYWAEGADDAATQAFVKEYTKATGTIPGAYIAGGYMTASLLAQVLKDKGLVVGSDLVSDITSFKFDSIFGKVSWEQGNNMLGPVYIREVKRHDDGKLYNDVIATYEGVSQYLGEDPQTVIDRDKNQPYNNSFQG